MNQGTAMGSAGENAAGDEIGKREISRHFLQAVEIKTKTGDQCFPVSLAGPLIEQLKDCSPELVGPGNRDLSSFFRNESDRTQSEAGIGRSHPAPPSQAPLLLEELFQRAQAQVLDILEISPEALERKYLSRAFLKSYNRPLWCFAENMQMGSFEKDELNEGKLKYQVRFDLRRGSYATLAMKAMYLRLKQK